MALISGNAGGNYLLGTFFADEILGLGGQDQLIGLGGDDRLDGGPGADQMDGGAGDDTFIVDHLNDHVGEAANSGIDTVRASVTYSLLLRPHVENLILTGSGATNGSG